MCTSKTRIRSVTMMSSACRLMSRVRRSSVSTPDRGQRFPWSTHHCISLNVFDFFLYSIFVQSVEALCTCSIPLWRHWWISIAVPLTGDYSFFNAFIWTEIFLICCQGHREEKRWFGPHDVRPAVCLSQVVSLPGAPGMRVSLAKFSAFRTITFMRCATVWYCSRTKSCPKARGTQTELFLWPSVSCELRLWGREGRENSEIKEAKESKEEGEMSSFTEQMFPL